MGWCTDAQACDTAAMLTGSLQGTTNGGGGGGAGSLPGEGVNEPGEGPGVRSPCRPCGLREVEAGS